MKFQAAIVSVALAMASVDISSAFTSPSATQITTTTRQQQQTQSVNRIGFPMASSSSALSVASSDIVDEVRRRKTREVRRTTDSLR